VPPRPAGGSADAQAPCGIKFAASAGDAEWARDVHRYAEALTAYVDALKAPEGGQEAPPWPVGPVVELSAWKACKATERGPLALAFDAYKAAALTMLRRWAPNSRELREQMRLGAELAGMTDPTRLDDHTRTDAAADTPEGVLALLYLSSLGLTQTEQRADRAASTSRSKRTTR
jgi:hypothetical protein